MTHPATPEVGGEAPVPASDPFLDIANDMLPQEEDEEQPLADEEPVEVEEVDPDHAEDEPEAEAEEDELPPIDPPVSWDADAKEAFAKLPRDLQETVQKREADRERFVQQKSQEAARAKSETQQAALQQLAEIERGYAQHIEQLASQFTVREPDMALLAENPALYAQQARAYQNAQAQQQQLQRQAQELAEQAKQREAYAEQQFHAEQHQKLVEVFPEYLDPTTGPKLQAELSTVAREMGYSAELIAQARADDILAMKTAADWKAKAAKYDALQASKMSKVRAAKGLPKVATPGVAQGSDQTRQARAAAAFDRAKSAKSIQDRSDAFAEYLTNSGII
jgi:hypothetical protein